jgi:hypothetical protein
MRLEMALRYRPRITRSASWFGIAPPASSLGATVDWSSHAQEARDQGFVEIPGPVPSWVRRAVKDPLHEPADMAALLASIYFVGAGGVGVALGSTGVRGIGAA